jgi:hypothetical protein
LARAPAPLIRTVETLSASRGACFLSELADRTGGMSFRVPDEAEMKQAASKIGYAVRSQYLIVFRPASRPDGKWHSVHVKVSLPDAHVHARWGYFDR